MYAGINNAMMSAIKNTEKRPGWLLKMGIISQSKNSGIVVGEMNARIAHTTMIAPTKNKPMAKMTNITLKQLVKNFKIAFSTFFAPE